MIRVAILGLLFVAVWLVVTRIVHFVRTREVDWTGVTFIIGFIVIAFYLRHMTGIGQ